MWIYEAESRMTVNSRVFRSGNSVAVRLPKEVALPEGADVTISKTGDIITIMPAQMPLAEMLRRLDELPGPGEIEERDPDIFPDRPGL
jgi:antitoxin VapB